MATVRPFRGLRYASGIPLADIIAPPYDVIDSAAQNRYYERHPHNIIQLEYGKVYPGDNDRENRYTRAAADYRNWREKGVLRLDDTPAFYLYEQEFTNQGVRKLRTGFIGAFRLEDYTSGQILPHEQTLSKPKIDRLELMRACQANFSSVFGLYRDENNVTGNALARARGNRVPDAVCTDEDGEIHRLWVITDPAVQKTVSEYMASQPVFIADGHHRYETALRFHQEQAAKGNPYCNHVLMTLVNASDPGLVVLPTHRLVSNIPADRFKRFAGRVGRKFPG